MKVSCKKSDLLTALQVVTRALPSTTANPDLTHILFESRGDVCKLSATNMKTYIATELASTVNEPGEVLIQGQFFLELVQSLGELGDPQVHLAVEPLNLRVHFTVDGDFMKYELSGRGCEGYPKVELIKPAEIEFEINGKSMREMLRLGAICASQSDTSIQGFRGVCLDLNQDSFKVASMDGNRLCKVSREMTGIPGQPHRWLLSMEVTSHLIKTLPDNPVVLRQQGNKFMLEFGTTLFQTVLSNADFVDYEDYIPEEVVSQESSSAISVNRVHFLNQLKGLVPVSRDNGNRVVFKFSQNKLEIRAFSEVLGEGYRELALENAPDDLEVAFNSRFIMDYLNAISDESILWYCEGDGMPAYFWANSEASEPDHVCVIMSLSMQ
jgi:DNA polymerase III subunit beta